MISNIEYMQQAIRLAQKGLYTTEPNPRVGCVIVKDEKIVGQGWHERAGEAHAEINALKQAGDKAKDAIVFVTLEPCSFTGKTPPCANALIKAGVKKVYVAMSDPNPLVSGKGLKKLQDAHIETDCGLLQSQAQALNPGFIKRMQAGRPFVRVKLAMSLDARTAMASGESKWISGEASRKDVQRMRAESSAILTGMSTVLADNPSMNVRLSADELGMQQHGLQMIRQPKRIVLDSRFKLADADITQLNIVSENGESAGGECIVYTTVNVEDHALYPVTIETIAATDGHVDLHALMKDLAKKEINLLHVEAGSVLCGALLKNDLVDEIIVYMAPYIMGDGAKGLFHLPELEQMKDRVSLEIKDLRMIGNDIRITAKPVGRDDIRI